MPYRRPMADAHGEPLPPDVHIAVQVPDDLVNGVYSNFLSVWSGPHDFTLDFAVTGQPVQSEAGVTVPAGVVARVKIPLTMAQDLLRAIAEQVSQFEAQAGPIRSPGDDRPVYPPDL